MASVPYENREKIKATLYWISGTTLIISRFKPDNLLHLFHDDLLPLFATIREHGLAGQQSLRIFFDDHWSKIFGFKFFKQLAPSLIYRQQLTNDSIICFENAYLGNI